MTEYDLPEPLATVLRDYLSVEWHELSELADDIKSRRQTFDVELFKAQLASALGSASPDVINRVTSNEFESPAEVREWLRTIYMQLFSDNAP